MNERIDALAVQAVIQANEVFDHKGKSYMEIVMAKYAELIVRECLWQVVKDNQVPQDIQVLIGGRFKEQFGVES